MPDFFIYLENYFRYLQYVFLTQDFKVQRTNCVSEHNTIISRFVPALAGTSSIIPYYVTLIKGTLKRKEMEIINFFWLLR